MHKPSTVEHVAVSDRKTPEGQERGTRLQTLFEDGTLLLAASVFGNGMNYLLLMFLARQLGMDEFGVYALGVTVFNALLLLMTTGADSGAVKFVSDRLALGDRSAACRMAVGVWLIAVGTGLLAAVGLALAAAPLAAYVYGKPGLALVLLLFAGALPFAMVATLLLSLLQAYRSVRSIALVKYLWEPLGKWGAAVLALAAGWGLAGVVGGLVVTFIGSAVLAAVILVRVAEVSPHAVATISKDDARTFAAFCFPLLAANLFGVVAPRMDVMLLGYWGSSADVGRYLVTFQTAAVLALVLGAFDVVFAPMISRAWARRDEVALGEAYHALHRLAAMATVPAFVVVVVFREEVMALFGGGTGDASAALVLLAIGYLVNAMLGGASTVLLMTGRSRTVLLNTVVYGIGLGLGAMLLIPGWGLVGAAAAASATLVGVNLLRVWQVWRYHRMLPWTRQTLKPLAGGFTMGLLLWFVKPYLSPVWFVPLAAIGGTAYLMLLYVMQLEDDDQSMVAATLARWGLARS
jgi:O-antigen/teichoic acid export membrane protein